MSATTTSNDGLEGGSGSRPPASAAAAASGERSEDAEKDNEEGFGATGNATMKPGMLPAHVGIRQFPKHVPQVVRTAILNFQAPAGYVLCPMPTSPERSILYYWGVRMEREGVTAAGSRGYHKQQWVCLASEKCRLRRRLLAITSGQTTNATQHLLKHNQQSSRSRKAKDGTSLQGGRSPSTMEDAFVEAKSSGRDSSQAGERSKPAAASANSPAGRSGDRAGADDAGPPTDAAEWSALLEKEHRVRNWEKTTPVKGRSTVWRDGYFKIYTQDRLPEFAVCMLCCKTEGGWATAEIKYGSRKLTGNLLQHLERPLPGHLDAWRACKGLTSSGAGSEVKLGPEKSDNCGQSPVTRKPGSFSRQEKRAANKKKRAEDANNALLLASTLFDDVSDRSPQAVAEVVRPISVRAMIPLSFSEDELMRHLLSVLSPGSNTQGLHHRATRKILVELYTATTRALSASMLKTVRAASVPIVYVNVDLWTSTASGVKYIGVRVFYLDEKMNVKSHILAVKLFRPAPTIDKRVTGDVVMKWVRQVLDQYGLADADIAGAVTDSGLEVRNGVASVFGWEGCIPHLLNRVTTDGSGMAPTREKSKNLFCRDLIGEVKAVVGYYNRFASDKIVIEDNVEGASTKGKASKTRPSQAVHRRWVSLARLLQRVLSKWAHLETFYVEVLKTAFPLADRKDEVEEVYSILHAVRSCIECCQTTGEPTGQDGIQRLVLLMTKTLEPASPMCIERVPLAGQKRSDDPALPERRRQEDLTMTGAATRSAFLEATARRVVAPRYGNSGGLDRHGHSHMFDMAMLLSPAGRSLKYLDALGGAQVGEAGGFAATPAALKDRVTGQLTSLVARAVVSRRRLDDAKGADGGSCGGGDGGSGDAAPKAKRFKSSKDSADALRSLQSMQEMREAGMLDSDDDDDDSDCTHPEEVSPMEEAQAIVKQWQEAKIPKEFKSVMSGANTCAYWREHGASLSPDLRHVAQSVLGVPASAAVLERDFCVASQVLSQRRGSLDPACAEMILFLRAAIDHIPREVPKLTEEQAASAVPERLRDPAKLAEVHVLYVRPEEEEDFPPTDASDDDDGLTCDGMDDVPEEDVVEKCQPAVSETPPDGEGKGKRKHASGGGVTPDNSSNNNSKSGGDGMKPCVDPECPSSCSSESRLVSGAHKCCACNGYMHAFCGTVVGSAECGEVARLCGDCKRYS